MEIPLPPNVTEAQLKEWVAMLAERVANAEVNSIPEVAAAAKRARENIDAYRKSIGLNPKFEQGEI